MHRSFVFSFILLGLTTTQTTCVFGQHAHHALPIVAATIPRVQTLAASPSPSPSVITTTWIGQYRPFNATEALIDWRTANNTVNEIGGWRVYAKEAARAEEARKQMQNLARPLAGAKK